MRTYGRNGGQAVVEGIGSRWRRTPTLLRDSPRRQFRSSSTLSVLTPIYTYMCLAFGAKQQSELVVYPSNKMNAGVSTPMDDEKTITPRLTAVEVSGSGVSEDALIEQYGAERVRKLLLKVRGTVASCR
jgi:hypothetical protein